MARILVNAGMFQAGWLLCVLYGNAVALACALVSALVYRKWFCSGARDGLLIAATLLVGFAGDTALGLAGVLAYPSGLPVPPFWMMTLWVLFAMTLPWSLRPLARRRRVFAVLCTVGGSFSYLAGVRLTGVSFGWEQPYAVLALGALWFVHGLVLPGFVRRWELAGP